MNLITPLLFALVLLFKIDALAAPGDVDHSFVPPAFLQFSSLALQTDGRIILYGKALQTDGKVNVAGTFAAVGGTARHQIARLLNDPSVQSLSASNQTHVQWLRSGATPDADGDGQTNLAEYQSRTHPRDPASTPAQPPCNATQGLLRTVPGRFYVLESPKPTSPPTRGPPSTPTSSPPREPPKCGIHPRAITCGGTTACG